jgi:hypothetical protein
MFNYVNSLDVPHTLYPDWLFNVDPLHAPLFWELVGRNEIQLAP